MSELHPVFELRNDEIYLVTTRYQEKDNGMIVTYLAPASLVPSRPRLVLALSPFNLTTALIRLSRRFVVHLLAENQHHLVPRFGLRSGRDYDKFRGLEIHRTREGLPTLAGTCGWVGCRVLHEIDSEDRIIYLAEVTEEQAGANRPPLRKNEAMARLSSEDRLLWNQKRSQDAERDRRLLEQFAEQPPDL